MLTVCDKQHYTTGKFVIIFCSSKSIEDNFGGLKLKALLLNEQYSGEIQFSQKITISIIFNLYDIIIVQFKTSSQAYAAFTLLCFHAGKGLLRKQRGKECLFKSGDESGGLHMHLELGTEGMCIHLCIFFLIVTSLFNHSYDIFPLY